MSSTFFNYLWQANLYLVLFYALYWVWLSRETFFTWNRVYLLGALVVSLTIPLLPSPEFLQKTEVVKQISTYRPVLSPPLLLTEAIAEKPQEIQNPEIIPTGSVAWKWIDYAWLSYWLVVSVLLLRIFLSFGYLLYLSIRYQIKRKDGYFLVKTPHKATFSFFNILFLGKASHLSDSARQQIIAHELAHIQQWHSLDIVFVSLLSAVCWFNPICWLYMKSLRKVHEYLADVQVMRSGAKLSEYMELLVKEMLGQELLIVHNPFSKSSLLKARCKMLVCTQSPFSHKIKLLAIIPLCCVALLFQWSCTPDGLFEVKSVQKIKSALPEGYKLVDTFFANQNTLDNEDFTLILADENEYMIRLLPPKSAFKITLFDATYKEINNWKLPSNLKTPYEIHFEVPKAGVYNLKVENTSAATSEKIRIDVAYKKTKETPEIVGVYSSDNYQFDSSGVIDTSVELEAGNQYGFSLSGVVKVDNEKVTIIKGKAKVTVYDNTNQVTASFGLGTENAQRHNFTCNQSGKYRIKVLKEGNTETGIFYISHLIPRENISR